MYILQQGLANFFYKGPECKYVRLCRLGRDISVAPLCHGGVKTATDEQMGVAVCQENLIYKTGRTCGPSLRRQKIRYSLLRLEQTCLMNHRQMPQTHQVKATIFIHSKTVA